MRYKKGTGSLASIRGWETMREMNTVARSRVRQWAQICTKGVIAGQRRPAGAEGNGGWQEIPNMKK